MNTVKYIGILFTIFGLTNCDPGLNGDLKVFNETSQTLKIKYSNSPVDAIDTVTQEIAPGDFVLVNSIGGLGNKKTFECCPNRTQIFSITSSSGVIKKEPSNCDNWTIPNKSKLRKYGKEKIKCEFHVTQADI